MTDLEVKTRLSAMRRWPVVPTVALLLGINHVIRRLEANRAFAAR